MTLVPSEIRFVILRVAWYTVHAPMVLYHYAQYLRCAASVMKVPCACLLVVALATSCATTKAHQREHLANPVMNPDGDGDLEALKAHMLGTREGTVGGFGSGGGGCGCN